MPERSQPLYFPIGLPARNEEALISRAVASILASADALTDPGSARLVVACDTCTDATSEIARELAHRDDRVEVIEGSWASAGVARAAALRRALVSVPSTTSLSDVWVATTDADTVVPVDWLAHHGTSWARGDHAVAGVVDLLDEGPAVRDVFARHYSIGRNSHGHVHGANLGVRADAYVRVGGFPPVALAEDHALWRALREAGFSCRSSVALRVFTSGRLTGRAKGGFADTLCHLVTPAPSGRGDGVGAR